jgi:hypothetical protein
MTFLKSTYTELPAYAAQTEGIYPHTTYVAHAEPRPGLNEPFLVKESQLGLGTRESLGVRHLDSVNEVRKLCTVIGGVLCIMLYIIYVLVLTFKFSHIERSDLLSRNKRNECLF